MEQIDIDITDENASQVVDKLFGLTNHGRPKIALQLFLYGLLVQERAELKDRPQSAEFTRLTRERLKGLLAEMTDPSVPFRRTEERSTCSYCDFKMICGR